MKKILLLSGLLLILIMAKALNADILTEFWIDKETFNKSEVPNKLE